MSEIVPENLIDMITFELLEDPVVAEDGYVYSRNSILDWFEGCEEVGEELTSPLTGRPMGHTLRPDPQTAKLVDNFKSRGIKSQRFNESTQTIGTLAKIFEIIEPMKDLFATKNWQAPALVVMGNENSGKSTLLERLAMMPIFPKDKFICTRMAIRVHLRRGPIMAPRLDVFDNQTGSVIWSRIIPMERGRDYVKEAMENVLIQEFGGLMGVSKTKMLILHITGPNCPDLDMVDLPGLVSTHVRGEPENMRALTADLVESYVKQNNPHSLYLIAVPATSAPNQSLAFEIVQKMGLHDKSIGVFTKSDKCDLKDESDGVGGLRDLRSKVYQQARDTVPLEQWGYVCTMNRPQDDSSSSSYSNLMRQSQEEVQFFQARGMSDLLGQQMAGCKALLTRVSIMFHEYLRNTWAPSTIIMLLDETADYRDREAMLGLPRADTFRPSHQPFVDGPDALFTVEEIASMAIDRAREILSTTSEKTMDTMAVEVLQRVHEGVSAESCSVSGKPSEVLAYQLALKKKISTLVNEALVGIQDLVVGEVTVAMANDQSDFKLGRFPHFLEALSTHFNNQIAPWKEKTEAALLSYVNVAFQSPLSNPHFKLKYTFKKDRSGVVVPLVEMDFDAEPLASTIVHTIVLRCSVLLTESLSMGPELNHMLARLNWRETCAEERLFLLNALYNVDQVIQQLSAHLGLTNEDLDHYEHYGTLAPRDTVHVVQQALQKASLNSNGHVSPPPPPITYETDKFASYAREPRATRSYR